MPDDQSLLALRTLALEHAQATKQLRVEMAGQRRQAASIAGEIARQARAGRTVDEALEEQRRQLRGDRQTLNENAQALAERLRQMAERMGGDPCDLSSAEPLLLLPVRLETRYKQDGRSTKLRVRIFPDTVHIDRLKRTLSDDERDAGQAYWTALWDGTVAATAWASLGDAVGRTRAAWVAEATRPTNAPSPGTTERPAFPPAADIAEERPVARLLPDRFVAIVKHGDGDDMIKAQGKLIVGDPVMGLFTEYDDEDDVEDSDGIPVNAEAKWITDYDQAEAAGLAITIDLPGPITVKSLTVFGVSRTIAAADAARELEDVLTAHAYSDGLAFVPQGTATNTVEDQRAGFTSAPALAPPGFEVAQGATGNAATLASALGIDPSILSGIDHAQEDEGALASAANVALWWPSWGTFLDAIDTDSNAGDVNLSDRDIENIRKFHRDNVRGRGPLPALRVGKQPYGILPVGTTDHLWRPGGVDQMILTVVRRARAIWRQSLDQVPHLGAGNIDQTTLELLRSSPVSLGVRARATFSQAAITAGKAAANNVVDTAEELETMLSQLVWEQIANASLSHRFFSLSKDSRPVSLPYAHDSDPEKLTAIANGTGPGEVKSILQALAAIGMSQAKSRAKKSNHGINYASLVEEAQGNVKIAAQAQAHVAQSAETMEAGELFLAADAVFAVQDTNVRLGDFQPSPDQRRSFAELAASSLNPQAKAELSGFALGEYFLSFGTEKEVRAAILKLAEADTDARTLVTAETLDTASHRLDAWVTGLVESRRRTLRTTTPQGLNIGAYGYVENIKPARGNSDLGFIHAPSVPQAVTAGLLRSAYLAHAREDGNGAFAIDLSSARVRDAMDLNDAIRMGQGLGEALGYRIERWLHEAKLDRIVRNLRQFAPGLQATPGNSADVPTEHMAGAAVLDGVVLIDAYRHDRFADILAAARAVPTDNPYLEPGSWEPLTDGQNGTVDEAGALKALIIKASDLLDATSDLLLAEAVHQMAQGNIPRASAALDAGGTGDAPSPIPTFVTTPASGGALTHRIMLVASETNGAGWTAGQPRAVAEPRLEAWAADRLGPADAIRVGKDSAGTILTLGGAGLCALDLVYGVADMAALERRIRAKLGLPPAGSSAEPLFDAPGDDWPDDAHALGDAIQIAITLRAILAAAQPVTGADISLPFAAAPHSSTPWTTSPIGIAQAHARAAMACGTLSDRLDALSAAIEAGATVEAELDSLADFGIISPAGGARADVAQLAVEEGRQRLAQAAAALGQPTATPETLTTAGQALFGEAFWILTPLRPVDAANDDWTNAIAGMDAMAKPSAIRRYLTDMGSVRAPVRRYADSLLHSDVVGRSPTLRAAQIRAMHAESFTDTWAGAGSAEGIASSWVLELSGDYAPGDLLCGLVIDQFVEAIVDRDTRTSAVAFNAPAPNARPPQSWLLAVAPNESRWTTDLVLATIDETIELAKLRGITLERVKTAARILPALYQQSWSLQGEDVIRFQDMLIPNSLFPSSLAFVKEK